jgi:hypothetical protein
MGLGDLYHHTRVWGGDGTRDDYCRWGHYCSGKSADLAIFPIRRTIDILELSAYILSGLYVLAQLDE